DFSGNSATLNPNLAVDPAPTPIATFTPSPVSNHVTVVSGQAFTVVLTYYKSPGVVETGFNGNVTIALNTGTAGALSGTLTATAQNGVVTFNNLILKRAGLFTLKATPTGLNTDIVQDSNNVQSIQATAVHLVPKFATTVVPNTIKNNTSFSISAL